MAVAARQIAFQPIPGCGCRLFICYGCRLFVSAGCNWLHCSVLRCKLEATPKPARPELAVSCRDVAQPGRALAWGARGRQFKSARPDHLLPLPVVTNPPAAPATSVEIPLYRQ